MVSSAPRLFGMSTKGMNFSSGILFPVSKLLFMTLKFIYQGFPSFKARLLAEFSVDSEAVCYIVTGYQFVQGWSPSLLEENIYLSPGKCFISELKSHTFLPVFRFPDEKAKLFPPLTYDSKHSSFFSTSLRKALACHGPFMQCKGKN